MCKTQYVFGIHLSICAILLPPWSHAEEPAKKVVTLNVVLEEFQGTQLKWESTLQLGSVSVDGTIELKLSIENKTKRLVTLNEFRSSCRCTVLNENLETLKPNSSSEVVLQITPQKSARSPLGTVKFVLFDRAETGDWLQIVCNYELNGLLNFTQPQYRIELRNDKERTKLEPIRIHFVFTNPVAIENLKVVGTGGLQEAMFEIEQIDGQYFIAISISPESIAESGLFGNVHLKDEAVGSFAECQLTITRIGDFAFSPNKVIMVWDDDSNSFVGSGVFRLYNNPIRDPADSEPPIDFTVSAIGCDVKSKKMDKVGLVHRINLELDDIEIENGKKPSRDKTVRLKFTCGEKSYIHSCSLVFLK